VKKTAIQRVEEMQAVELALWDDLRHQDWLENLANKLSELRWLLPKFSQYDSKFRQARFALELGGGDGWAACVVKRLYPELRVAASDISGSAVSGIGRWERIFEASVDLRFSCKSYEIPLPDDSVDLIFTFQAAHHFRLHEETLSEVARVLRVGGTCLYLHEPSCRRYLYRLAKWRVNRKRPECPEDVLCLQDLRRLAVTLSFQLDVNYSPVTINRGVFEGLYYKVLSVVPGLCQVLPCTADFVFSKT